MKAHVKQSDMTVCLMLAKISTVATLQNRLLTMSQLGSVDIVGYSRVKETSVSHLTDTEYPASSSE